MGTDEEAMRRRDEAAARHARICPECDGTGQIWVVVDGDVRCPICNGETWIDQHGKPLKIDPDNVHITVTR